MAMKQTNPCDPFELAKLSTRLTPGTPRDVALELLGRVGLHNPTVKQCKAVFTAYYKLLVALHDANSTRH